MPCSGILGSVRLGHGFAIPTPHYTTFFCARKMLRIFLIGRKKTSVTCNVNRHQFDFCSS